MGEPIELAEQAEPTTPAEPATLAEPATPTEPAILTDIVAITESIAPHEASLIVPDQASLFYRLNRTVGFHLIVTHQKAKQDMLLPIMCLITDGTVERYKARLVAKGFTQTYEVDYYDTFAPMTKMNTVRVLLSLAVNLDWTLRQFDVKIAFLHGELEEEEVYMSLPPGYSAGKVNLLIIYVDDMIVTGDDIVEIEELYKRLAYEFEKKDLGSLKYFLAMEVSVTSQFMHSPSEDHMAAVMRILSYLKSAPGRDKHSTSGYFTFVGGNLVTWRSKKQNVVSRSSTESEYRGIAQWVCEILCMRWLLAEIGFRLDVATKLHCDGQSAFEIANNLVQHDRTKHVEVDRHFIKEKLEHKFISIPFVPSLEQIADMLTHAVSKRRFEISLNSWALPISMHQ
ncbi:unnamed protein product, partial [Prunus brigantina]